MSNAWRWGAVVFDEARGILTVDGARIEIDRSCRAILSILLAEAGNPVPKERLLEAGWPNRIVHENSLVKAIGRLREALGEQGGALITVYGHGYTLKASPERIVSAQEGRRAPEASPRRGWRRLAPAYRAAVVLAAVAPVGVAGWSLWSATSGDFAFRDTPPITHDAPDAIGTLLWVDDNPQNNTYEVRFFRQHRIAVHIATSTADALKLLPINDYKMVVSDLGRSEDRLAGLKLVEAMRARGDRRPVYIYTVSPVGAEGQRAQRELVLGSGAQGLAVTPQEIRTLVLAGFGNPPARGGG